MSKPPSHDEQLRRAKQRAQQQRQGVVIFGETPSLDLPGVGRVEIQFANRDLAYVERELTPLLDELPERLRVDEDGDEFVNVWDALDVLGNRYPMDTIGVLLYAATRHAGLTREQVDNMPPSIFRDPNVETALGQAIAISFGAGTEEEEATGPTEAAETPAASTGEGS